MCAPYRWDVLDGKLNDNPLILGLGRSSTLLKSALWHENESAGMPTSKAGHTRDNQIVTGMHCIRRFAIMNITRLITLTAILGIGLAMAPAANADKSHGPFAVRLGVGVPLDNNMRDWKDVDVISGFSYFINHSRGATTITGVDLDTQLHTKHGNSAHAMGITYTVRKLMGDDTGSQNYVGLGLGIYRQPALPILVARR
jgi:hypothetical protein